MNRKQRSNRLGEAVRAARTAAGLTQDQLSLAMHYDYNVASQWENAAKPLSPAEWDALCAALPALDPALATQHGGELHDEESPKARPSRLDQRVTIALNELVAAKGAGRMVSDIARDMGLDYVAFWKMLKGTTNPTHAHVRHIAAYFQVDTDQVLGVRPVAAPSYAALQALVLQQREALKDQDRIRKLNDLLLERGT